MKPTELLTLLSNPSLLVIVLLGVFSITRLITTDTFPIFEKTRMWLLNRFPPDGWRTKRRPTNKNVRFVYQASNGYYDITKGHWFGELIQCPWCAGFWVSVFATLFLLWVPKTGILILSVFAYRAAAGLISQLGHH